jgi:hypothetical protein
VEHRHQLPPIGGRSGYPAASLAALGGDAVSRVVTNGKEKEDGASARLTHLIGLRDVVGFAELGEVRQLTVQLH